MIKLNFKSKLIYFFKICIMLLIFCFNSHAENLKISNNLITIGSNEAKVKIKVFSSLTCPHCADFHAKIIPKIKKEYVDSGKVQIILIDFPLDIAAFNASKLLHCLDEEKQIKFLDIIYEKQNMWTTGETINDINDNLKKIVENLGINSTKFDKCLLDQRISDKILDGRINANKKYSINSTPTIVINEKKLEGSADFKNIRKNIEKLI